MDHDFELVLPRDFEVTMVDRTGAEVRRTVAALGERLAVGLSENLHRGLEAVAVDGVPILGRCVRCGGLIFPDDWRAEFPAGLVCESCPLGSAMQRPRQPALPRPRTTPGAGRRRREVRR